MLHKVMILLFLVCITSATIVGQHSISMKEGKSLFEGLTKTKEAFIRDQIFTNQNEKFDLTTISRNVQLLKNIPGIKQANYLLDTIGNDINVTYELEELNTLVPIINLGGIHNNVWFRLGITDYNWRGKGQFLTATYQNNNGLHSGHLYFKKPRGHKSVWGYSASASSWSSEEPLYFEDATVDYIYHNHGLGLSAIRHFGENTTLEYGNTAFIEVYNKQNDQDEENLPGPEELTQRKILSKVALVRNHLNYNDFYISGMKWDITYQNVLTLSDDIRFNSLQLQGLYYLKPTTKSNLAIRFKMGISSNDNSPFAPFVADSHVNIRGIGNRISRGTAEAVINIEYRTTIQDNYNWASQIVAFSDIGSWRNPGGKLSEIFDENQIRHFVGIGGRVNYKKLFGATLRIDYGIDLYNPEYRGIVLGLGQYF